MPKDIRAILFNPWTVSAAAMIAILSVMGLALIARVDASARSREESLVANGLQSRIAELEQGVVPQTDWDDAVTNLDNKYSTTWAQANIGQFLTQTAGFELVAVLSEANAPRFGVERDVEIGAPRVAIYAGAASALLTRVRALERERGPFKTGPSKSMISAPIQASAVKEIDGRVYVLTATLVQPDFGTALPRGALAPIVITGEEVDATFLTKLSDRFLLKSLAFRKGAQQRGPHKAMAAMADDAGHTVATLIWSPERPGSDILRHALGPMLLLLFTFCAGVHVLYRRNWTLTESLLDGVRRVEQEKAETAQARAADRAKSLFLANMSHELRTPLNAIIGYSEMMMESAGHEQRTQDGEDHGRILGAANHLLGLINNLLDLSKIEAGRMQLHITSTDVGALLSDAVETLRPLATRNAVAMESVTGDGLAAFGTDADKFRQCVFNLLSNACKFSKGGRVDVFARRVSAASGDILRVDVRDTGIGLSEDQIARLFQPYAQATSATRSEFGGTGLGLSVTREIARLLGGDVRVTSTLGVGSTFTLEVAAQVPERARADAAAPERHAA